MNYADLALRWIHIISAIILVGGTVFWRMALLPALQSLPDSSQTQFQAALRSKWSRWVMATSGLLLISGLINAVLAIQRYQFEGPLYHILVTVKLLLALVVFWLAAVLSGRSAMAEKFRASMGYWLSVNVVLAIILVGVAGVMKLTPREPKPETDSVSVLAPVSLRDKIDG